MDIVIHGTKGGRQIFTPKKLGGLLDVNSDASKASAIGQEAYAIRFIEKTIIFSKYKIIRDVRGDKRTGFLAFSLFLAINEKLHGIDIISVLNKVSEEYYKKYIPENDNNLKDVREDWAFLDRISEEYKTILRPVSYEDIENLLSGTKDDAFIYYENDEKLQKYFDAPYQDKYSQYRQVLFVKEAQKDKPEDPLNALRHSEDNLSGMIDLENLKYKLLFKQTTNQGVRIDVKVNRVTRPSNSKVRLKDELEISWSKQFCESVTKRGTLNEISNEFIDVNSSSESVSIKEILPPFKIKTITFNIKDWKGNPVYGANLICKYAGIVKTVENYNQVTFKGEELGNRWTVSASNNRLLSDDTLINFAKEFPGDSGSVDIILNKHELKITVHEGSTDGDIIKNYRINKREFIGSEIEKPHEIFVESREHDSSSFDYHPLESEIDQHVVLQKKQFRNESKTTHSYNVSAGEHGTLKGGSGYTSNDKNGNDVRQVIVPNEGYKFKRFEEQVGLLVAQYEKKGKFSQTPKIIAVSIVGALVIGFGIWAFFSFFWKDELDQPQLPQQTDIQHPAKPATEKNPDIKIGESQKDETQPAKPEAKKGEKNEEPQIKQPANSKQKKVDTPVSLPANTNKLKDITKELKSGTVTRNELENWKTEVIDKNKKNSIDLYLQFWKLVLEENNPKEEAFKKLWGDIKKDPVLKSSELESFLHGICKDSKAFSNNYKDKINKVPKNPTLTLKKLKDQTSSK